MPGLTASEYLPRHLDAALSHAANAFPVVLVDGPRGAGKTTSAWRLAASVINLPDDLVPDPGSKPH